MKTVKLELIRCDCNRLLLKVEDGRIEVHCPRCHKRHTVMLDKAEKTD